MCRPGMAHRFDALGECTCGCCGCGCGPVLRRFFSAQEQRERLENYRDQLKKELVGVEQRINECECK